MAKSGSGGGVVKLGGREEGDGTNEMDLSVDKEMA